MYELPHPFEAEQEERMRIPVRPERQVSGRPSRPRSLGGKPGFCVAPTQREDERRDKSLYGKKRGRMSEVRVKCGDQHGGCGQITERHPFERAAGPPRRGKFTPDPRYKIFALRGARRFRPLGYTPRNRCCRVVVLASLHPAHIPGLRVKGAGNSAVPILAEALTVPSLLVLQLIDCKGVIQKQGEYTGACHAGFWWHLL